MPLKKFLKRNKDTLGVFALFLMGFSFLQFRVKEIIGFDGWLHMKMADIIRDEGFIRSFPYVTESILAARYADLQLLFRVLLIPFTLIGLIPGAKIAAVLFSSLCFTFFYWYLKKSDINYPLFWTLLYALSSVDLMYRFLLPRAMPLAVLSLILTFYLMEKKKYNSLFITSLLFAWLYSGFVFQILVVGVYFTIMLLAKKELDLKLLLYPGAGALTALVLNPYFPNNISMLYTQIFKVNLINNLYNMEWRAWGLKELFRFNWVFFLLFILALSARIRKMRINRKPLFFLAISSIFLIAMLKTRRMHEYFAPFTVLFAAFSLNSAAGKLRNKKIIRYAFAASIAMIMAFSVLSINTYTRNNHFLPWYEKGALWLRDNIPEGSKVFINGYTFNYLFFYDHSLRYTHGIDLTYSYLHDKDKFIRYMDVLQGKEPGYNIIKEDYGADYAFVGKIKQDIQLFNHVINHKEDFELLYEDESVGILKVR
ncbi:hypothetical protein KY358_00500 [Candidatus Woesearchaeota archaeon]|nr:hypothetical protein [Candidatus Woesearchaeota archaeon]